MIPGVGLSHHEGQIFYKLKYVWGCKFIRKGWPTKALNIGTVLTIMIDQQLECWSMWLRWAMLLLGIVFIYWHNTIKMRMQQIISSIFESIAYFHGKIHCTKMSLMRHWSGNFKRCIKPKRKVWLTHSFEAGMNFLELNYMKLAF